MPENLYGQGVGRRGSQRTVAPGQPGQAGPSQQATANGGEEALIEVEIQWEIYIVWLFYDYPLMANNNFNVSSSSIVHENSLVLSLNSSLGQDHVNGQGRIIPQSLAPTIAVQPNNLFVPQRAGLGQIALGQRLSEARRTHVSSLSVRIRTIIEYLPTEQNQIEALPLYPTSDYTVTEIPRTTQFLPPASPRELPFAPNHNNVHLQSLNPNDGFRIQGQPNFQNHNLTMSNQVNQHNAYRPYSPPNRQMINFMNLDHLNHSHGNNDEAVLNPEPLSAYASPGISRAQNPNLNLGQNHNLETSQLDIDQVRINPRDEARDIPNNQSSASSEDEEEMSLNDGLTRSLPHQKYGPYICPRCKKICETSQTFAAHMLTHYRVENKEQRKRRQTAKNNKKNLHQIHSRGNGLTISPVCTKSKVPLKVYARRKKAAGGKAEMVTSKRVVDDKVQKEGQGNTVLDEASSSRLPSVW
ncbi:zinc finger family protein [Populus alba x Populus x berolinensis]|nr:zinc finger family protein [Populus alba x Populus x berolinensis]